MRPISAGYRPRAAEPHAKEPVVEKNITPITHAGLDAHQETIHAAVLLPGAGKPVED